MRYRPKFGTCITLLATAFVVGSVVIPGTFAYARDKPSSAENTVEEPEIEIDCAERKAQVLASDSYEYSIAVASVEISSSGTGIRSSTSGTYDGNETVSFDGEEFVFVFVTEAETGETVAATYENCALAETTTERETRDQNATPSIRIDCNESRLEVTAPEDEEYVLRVESIVVEPEEVDSTSAASSVAGNASATFDGNLVYAFVEDDSSDDPVASNVEYCGPIPVDETDSHRTTRQTTANSTTTVSSAAPQ